MADDIPMDVLSSSGASDASSFCSTGPTTPASSPLFRPSGSDDLAVLTQLAHLRSIESVASEPVKSVCVVGAGYVGGPTAAVLALHHPSITVEVLDRDPRRIQQWQSPHLPVHESGLETVVRIVRDGADMTGDEGLTDPLSVQKRGRNLFFTCDTATIARADIVFMSVNTPTKTFGVGAGCATNMTAFDSAMREVAAHAKPGAIIVEKSTVPGGTAERVRKMLSTYRPGVPFEVLSNPEFLAEGCAIDNLTTPDRVLIGSAGTPSGRRAARTLANLYEAWVPPSKILQTNSWSSELAKLVANAMLAQRISSINSISAICEKTGAEVDQVAHAIGLDARIGPQFLKAGLGFGGSCFRKDIASLAYLAESLGLEDVAHYWRQVNVMNERQRDRFSRKVIDRFDRNLVGRKIAILGFAFKKNTGDTRESLSVDVIRQLLEERPAEIAIFDPYCRSEDILREIMSVAPEAVHHDVVKISSDPYLACSQAHAVLVVTDCDQFRNTPPKKKRAAAQSVLFTQKSPAWAPAHSLLCHDATLERETWTHDGVSYQLNPQDACPPSCSDCRTTCDRPSVTEQVEWTRIAYNMLEPRWVFDGRGLLDAAELEKLGVRVDTVGRRTA
ncbi:hypothetical protein N7474_004599 [Penicillium riverlandense]|uniref:uncharacterized protein n=1 Tax=Penicillium riverlandense TaxID=1903569 RepID=UPI0025488875|nr:uncharacterized protein N7474_004599 [Penicillium riverlandense]KAJ5819008.1 hypothetical protein N7474_004599 [Penicillium riverlandense]